MRTKSFTTNKRRSLIKLITLIVFYVFVPKVAWAIPATLLKTVSKVVGGNILKQGRVKVTAPRLAETGDSVPIYITVDSPMTATNFVDKVYIFAEKNNDHHVLTASLGPMNAKAELFTRIRLITSQKVLVVAKMNDDSCWASMVEVEVTRSDCG